jgi:serine/threonine protein phosphatase PrpC
VSLDAAGRSAIGPHPRNEDAWLCLPDRGLFAVADGVGGRPHGDVASTLFVDTIAAGCQGPASDERLATTFLDANRRLLAASRGRGLDRPMATVGTVAWLDGTDLRIGHVGDTRLYLLDAHGVGTQLTADHTVDSRWADAAAPAARGSHQLTAAIGVEPRDDTTAWMQQLRVPVMPGNVLVLVTDGVSDAMGRGDLAAVTAGCTTAAETAELVLAAAAATRDGAGDDATIVVVRIGEPARRWRRFFGLGGRSDE